MSTRAQDPSSLEPLEGGSSKSAGFRARSWEKFSQWVSCMCVVTFDLELGQAIEVKKQAPVHCLHDLR